MKKLFFCAILSAALFSGCKKEYTCTCTNPNETVVAFSEKTTEGKAESKCQDYYNDHYGSIPFNETTCTVE